MHAPPAVKSSQQNSIAAIQSVDNPAFLRLPGLVFCLFMHLSGASRFSSGIENRLLRWFWCLIILVLEFSLAVRNVRLQEMLIFAIKYVCMPRQP
jgi:hypothetical protein